jgi:peptidoglycan hydrolase-like protein with peptidoglycan-binding domain
MKFNSKQPLAKKFPTKATCLTIVMVALLVCSGFVLSVKAQTTTNSAENAALESLATRSPLIRQILLQILSARMNSSNTSASFNGAGSGYVVTAVNIPPLTTSLAQGSNSVEVQNLQKFLNAKGYTVTVSGQETTTFGPATESALRRYQAVNNLPQTGQLDVPTRTTINLSVYRPTTNLPSTSTTTGSTTAAEFTFPAGFIQQPTRQPNTPEITRWQSFGLESPTSTSGSSLSPGGSTSGQSSLSPGNQNATLGSNVNSPDAFSTLLGVAGSLAISRIVKPFGGTIAFSTICTCTPGVRIQMTNGDTLMYLPIASDINAYYNIFIPRVALLGTSLPVKVPCLQGLGFAGFGACTDTGLKGDLIRVVGTSLLPNINLRPNISF